MVTEHKKYEMQVQSKADRKQSRLGTDGALKMSTAQVTMQTKEIDFTQRVMCPFCLHLDTLQAFLISAKQGVSHHKAQCPECRTVMMMKSLTAEWTPEQYAEWIYPYGRSGFWQKCKFETWKKRLAQIGWTQRFWDRYKQLKGETIGEYTAVEDEEAWKEYIGDNHE